MSEIEFNDNLNLPNTSNRDRLLYSRLQRSSERPNIVNFLIKKGVVKAENAANVLLLTIAGIFFLSAILLIYFFFFYTPKPTSNAGSVPPQVLIMQKTREYVNQGLTPEEARTKATEEVNSMPQNNINK